MIRVPFFLLVGFNKGTPPKKGKRVLLGNLVYSKHQSESREGSGVHGLTLRVAMESRDDLHLGFRVWV